LGSGRSVGEEEIVWFRHYPGSRNAAPHAVVRLIPGWNIVCPAKKQRKTKKTLIVPPAGISGSGTSICVVCQLYGIPEEKIRIDLDRTQLVVSAAHENEMVKRIITVPEGSRISSKKFHDGILEVILERP
jgi:HSP20 family molecular chaperone IbpA